MKDLKTLTDWSDKQLRTLRNNLNNRLESFKKDGTAKALQASHVLYNKSAEECKELLKKVKDIIYAKNKSED